MQTDKSKDSYENGEYPYLIAKTKIDNKWTHIKYHDLIMKDEIEKYRLETGYTKQIIVDHISGKADDNRRKNLRVRTQSENNMNKEVQCNNTSSIVGVSWHIRDKIWNSQISINNKKIHLGNFYYMRNAVKARIEAEIKFFGEHVLRERENNTYREYIDYILALPNIKEPIIKANPNNEFNILGIKRKKNGKFEARIYDKANKIDNRKTFNNLQDAIKWRKEKEIEIFGQEIMYENEKQEKLI